MIDDSRDAMYEALWLDLRRNRTDADLIDVDWSIPRLDPGVAHPRTPSTTSSARSLRN